MLAFWLKVCLSLNVCFPRAAVMFAIRGIPGERALGSAALVPLHDVIREGVSIGALQPIWTSENVQVHFTDHFLARAGWRGADFRAILDALESGCAERSPEYEGSWMVKLHNVKVYVEIVQSADGMMHCTLETVAHTLQPDSTNDGAFAGWTITGVWPIWWKRS